MGFSPATFDDVASIEVHMLRQKEPAAKAGVFVGLNGPTEVVP